METITPDGYADVGEACRRHDLQRALYDAGGAVMADSPLVPHGAGHRLRHRMENRLCRRGTLRYGEKTILRDPVRDTLAPFLAAGRADPDAPAERGPASARDHFASYPVVSSRRAGLRAGPSTP
ncbi:MAG: hypothetical protein J0I49_24595 [Pseudonocardia sp.]|jgi:hypothetical protein|uniref:hypothetical protein n=1 Tax=Pseudonocardia sp. TaxID=60912 RepID=UPI001AC2D243|nr:hypothetical protein [Pseudonocardia sp.]MBN9101262.1 hypothetical protein [Pseudonocardia sp.]